MNRYYTTFEAARVLGVSLPTVVNWIKARRLKAHRTPGGHRRIAREDLAAFMVNHGMPLAPELSDAAPARRKALLIADAGPHREGLARRVAAAGYAMEQASPGFAAGAAAARFAPDVVILYATSADGGEVLRALLADRELASVPVVAIAQADWTEGLVAAGCAAAVAGAATEDGLEQAIEGALREAGSSPPRTERRGRRGGATRRPARAPR